MLDDPTIDKLAPLLMRLGSGNATDRATTAAAADRLLRDHGTSWEDLIFLLHDALVRMRHPTMSQETHPGKVASDGWRTLPYLHDRPVFFWRSMPDGVLLTVQEFGDTPQWTATVAGRTVEWDDDNSCWYTSFKEAMSGALIEHHKRRVRYPR